MDNQPNNPLHGVKLADIVTKLQEKFGWEGLAAHVDIRCFQNDPSVKSSLKFLRKTPWAREKVEQLYVDTFFNTQEDDMATFQWKSIKK
ncbi:VF530 family DNA-binding protein [Pseudoalteromonas sp. bablab_jr011]|uniref:VF530 family protein n=1 Tax=Pseudoalteromonas sp. bablab_jr011 TaxID=2755062 RepID=UPI0018F7B47F|nr:VF530 family protein [Pseudoalteromonas sp. bablab_jr011]